jgi:LacI family transcriptional regulator
VQALICISFFPKFSGIVSIMSVSIKDVARHAGVSLGTVSNAINRPQILSEKTLKKVQSTISELGFVPNASARTLRAGRTRVLGLVVPDIANPFFTELSKGVNDAALQAGYAVILCNTDESTEKETQYLGVLAGQKVQGILITPARDTYKSVAAIQERGIAVALVDREVVGTEVCSVAVDDEVGGRLALNHLHELGHKEILVLTGAANIPQVHERENGIKSALLAIKKSERPNLKYLRVPQMASASAHEELNRYLKQQGLNFTACICGNDLIALGAIRALRDHEYSVPADVSIIGYDDIDFAANANVPLTTISQPKYRLGYAAAELIIQECEDLDSHVHQRIEFQPQLIVRHSTSSIK